MSPGNLEINEVPTVSPEKLETLVNEVTAKFGQVKALWQRWEIYVIGMASALAGGFLVHVLKL